MKSVLFLACLLLLAALLSAADFFSALSPYLEPNLSVNIIPLNTTTPSALVLIEGQETMVIKGDQILTSADGIAPVLREHIINSADPDSLLASARSNVSEFSIKFNASESACARLTGMDHLSCTDRESCVRAAFANPNSQILVNADGFWQSMLDWRIKRDALDSGLGNLSQLLSTPPASSPDAAAMRERLSALRNQAVTLNLNHLYLNRTDPGCEFGGTVVCYEYCPKADWSAQSSGWLALEDRFSAMEISLDSLPNQSQRAADIANRTASWMDYSRQKGSIWAGMASDLASRSKEIQDALSAPAASDWNDTSLQADFSAYLAQVNATSLLAADGKFHRAISRREALDNQSDSILARIQAHNQKADSISDRLRSVSLAIIALSKSGNANDSATLSSALASLNSSFAYPLAPDQLADLDNKSAQLEQLALAQVARRALGAPSSGPELGAAADAIQGSIPANVSNPANASAPANKSGAPSSGPANASGASAPPSNPLSVFGFTCPLPAALVLLALAGLSVFSRQ